MFVCLFPISRLLMSVLSGNYHFLSPGVEQMCTNTFLPDFLIGKVRQEQPLLKPSLSYECLLVSLGESGSSHGFQVPTPPSHQGAHLSHLTVSLLVFVLCSSLWSSSNISGTLNHSCQPLLAWSVYLQLPSSKFLSNLTISQCWSTYHRDTRQSVTPWDWNPVDFSIPMNMLYFSSTVFVFSNMNCSSPCTCI